jgi:hypothetical protein
VGDRAVYQRGSGWRAISAGWGLLLPLALNIPSARADAGANGVQVICPDLPEARTAELEARARATLLTSDRNQRFDRRAPATEVFGPNKPVTELSYPLAISARLVSPASLRGSWDAGRNPKAPQNRLIVGGWG